MLLGHTHYAPKDSISWYLFSVEDCETCGRVVQAANTVSICEHELNMIHLWELTKMERLPPELFWNDEVGGCTCEGCGNC